MIYIFCFQIFLCVYFPGFFFFKQMTAYEVRISDWSSDMCSSDLRFYGPRPDALRPPDLRYASEMIGLIRRAMSSWIVLGLLGLVLIAFIVTGVGDPFGSMGGGGRRLAKVGGAAITDARSDERRVGEESVSTCRSRLSTYH